MKNFAREVSFYGDWPGLVVGALLVAGVGVLVKRRCTRAVCIIIVAASLAGLGANVLRATTGRTRPFKTEQAWHGPTIKHSRNSFPSAHTSSAAGFFFALVLLAPRIGLALLPLALLVGWSRIYLNQHHFSDVVGGLVLGAVAAIFTVRVLAPRWDAYRSRKRALAAADDPPVEQPTSSRQQV
jgi:undecaprenyl-diphosphatase